MHKKALLLDLQLDPQYASGYIFHFFILKFEHVADYFTFSLPFVTVTFTFLFLKNLLYLHGMSIYENSWKTHLTICYGLLETWMKGETTSSPDFKSLTTQWKYHKPWMIAVQPSCPKMVRHTLIIAQHLLQDS